MLKSSELFSSEHYDTSLRLYSSVAEAELVSGNTDGVEAAVAVISNHALSSLDKIPSYLCLIKSHIARGRSLDAISTGFDALAKLGVSFPKAAGTLTIIRDFMKTKTCLRGKTDEQLKQLPAMTDKSKIAAMRILDILRTSCYYVRQDLLALVHFRMVRLSIKYGCCHVSPVAFA
eukprot:10108906-Ditylum_brightwellii.AAC.1